MLNNNGIHQCNNPKLLAVTQRFLGIMLIVGNFLGLDDGYYSRVQVVKVNARDSRNKNKVKQDTSYADYHQRIIKGSVHQVPQNLSNIFFKSSQQSLHCNTLQVNYWDKNMSATFSLNFDVTCDVGGGVTLRKGVVVLGLQFPDEGKI